MVSEAQVHVDVLVLSSGGTLLDSLALALCAVLSETLLPKVRSSFLECLDHLIIGIFLFVFDVGILENGICLDLWTLLFFLMDEDQLSSWL